MSLTEHPQDQTYVLSLWKGRLDRPPPPLSMMWRVADQVAARHGLTVADLVGPCRRREYSGPRQEAMFELYETRLSDGRRRWSYPSIGKFLGGRDHSTIIAGVAAHEARLEG